MIEVTFYEESSGDIIRQAMLDPKTIGLNTGVGESWVYGNYSEDFVVINGKPKKKPTKELRAKQAEKDWQRFKQTRNALLKESDWTQVSDAPVDSKEWAKYRQELRDLPTKVIDPSPDKIKWPKSPDNKDKT